MKPGSTPLRSELHAALLEYYRDGGRHALAPSAAQLPLACIKELLQLASGRSSRAGANNGAVPDTPLRRAACFFIRSELLRPGADHYALLGLEHHADAATIKDHYRLMMRLLHPDFSSGWSVDAWPADAASRVNLAYECLSTRAQRRAYDERFAAAAPPASPRPLGVVTRARASKAPVRHPRQRLRQLALLFGGSGTLALLAGLLTNGSTESLVQRPGEAPASHASAMASVGEAAPAATLQSNADAVEPSAPARPPPTPARTKPAMGTDVGAREAIVPSVPAVEPHPPPPTVSATAVSAESAQPAAAPRPTGVAAGPTAPPAPLVPAPSSPAVTLAEAHPVFSLLLQEMESGWAERVAGMLDRPARVSPATQALLARYSALVEERRPVKLSGIAFSSHSREGHLLMTGRVLIGARNEFPGIAPGELALEAEFGTRNGRVVITRLAPAPAPE